MRTTDQTPLELGHAVLQLVHDAVDRAQSVGRRSLRPDDVAVAVHGDLADLAFADPGVALLEEPDLGVVHAVDVSREATQLLLDDGAQRIRDLDVLGPDGDLHPYLLVVVRRGRASTEGLRAYGPRAADLVFDPTLACGRGGEPAGGGKCPGTGCRGFTSLLLRAPVVDRPEHGQDLLLSRTMLSNHGLPYVGRFACDWLRLATTDPHAAHDAV